MKVLPQGSDASKRARYRFEREIEVAASLQHPNIVTVFDSGITEGKYFYAMEYIEGLPLDDYIRSKELSQLDIMGLFEKVTSATAYAHQHGIRAGVKKLTGGGYKQGNILSYFCL